LHIYNLLSNEAPMTVRQVFYRLVSSKVIGKTEQEYKGTVCRLLTEMRRDGEIPYGWIADNTRWMRKPKTHSDADELLRDAGQFYRRDLWRNQKSYVEIWLEKDALAGVLYDITEEFDVPLMVTRGYPSLSFLHSAAETILHESRPTYLYYFGDRDPSGTDIPRFVERELRKQSDEHSEIYFKVMAVTPSQIEELKLETRPTKKTDTRSQNFDGQSVELDAIPPNTLRQMVRECIEQHIDRRRLSLLQGIEEEERNLFCKLAEVGLWKMAEIIKQGGAQ
jgi:hypothetical protein